MIGGIMSIMKKALLFTLTFLICIISVVPITVGAKTSGKFKYEVLKNKTVKITKYTGSAETLTIPEKLGGYPVAYLDCDWYSEKTKVLNLPYTLTDYYELGGNKLKAINVDTDNKKFSSQDGVLFNKKKTKLLQFPRAKSVNVYNVPNTVKEIAVSAFEASKIKGINFPESVEKIGNYAFEFCEKLTSIIIPAKIKELGFSTFYDCKNLKKVMLNASLKEIKDNCFFNTGLSSINLNDGLEKIGYNAFGNTSISSVTFPKSLKYLNGFSYTNVSKAYIPASVKTIGEGCFQYCDKLKTVTLHNGLKAILSDAFDRTRIKKINLPKSLTYIAIKKSNYNIFPSSLKMLSVSKDNKKFSVKNGILYNKKCTKLLYYPNSRGLKTYTTPKSVKTICENAFLGARINKVVIKSNIKNVESSAFYKSKTKKVIFKSGIKRIKIETFLFSTVKKVVLPKSVTKIEKYAFDRSNLKFINIPQSVKYIGERAFFGTKLGAIIIPSSVKKIDKEAIGIICGQFASNGGVNKKTVIHCKKNSAAYKYAKKYKVKYKFL